MSDRVTWLLPVKNGMPYLPETLASIEAQTYTNWEVLAWDNGSTDGTVEELKKWIPSRLPGRVITGEPLGLGDSLSQMVKQCGTELCARIDADDTNLPERLEQQVAFLDAHPEVAVVGSQMYCMHAQGVIRDQLYTVPLHHDDIVHEMLSHNSIAHPSVLFRRSAVLQVGNYQNGVNIEDYDLWLRVAVHYKLANLDVPLVCYRIHDRSTTQLAIRENRMTTAMDNCFIRNAPLLYGCSESDARLLRERRHPFAIQTLYQIAKHLHHSQGSKLIDRLRSDSFINVGKSLVSPKDVFSRLALAALNQRKDALPTELFSTARTLILKLPGLRRTIELAHQLKQLSELAHQFEESTELVRQFEESTGLSETGWEWKRQLHKWLEQRRKEGSVIHPSLNFTGIRPPFDMVEINPGCSMQRDITVWLSPDEGAQPKLVLKGKAYVGQNVLIGVYQPITIGEFAQIGAYSYIISANHRYETRDIPIMQQGFVGAPILIEDDAWLGTHVVVLPGVTIGKGAIVAAGSVVNRDIPPYEVWGGVPAKFIKHRP